jgi:hypothetical protein
MPAAGAAGKIINYIDVFGEIGISTPSLKPGYLLQFISFFMVKNYWLKIIIMTHKFIHHELF